MLASLWTALEALALTETGTSCDYEIGGCFHFQCMRSIGCPPWTSFILAVFRTTDEGFREAHQYCRHGSITENFVMSHFVFGADGDRWADNVGDFISDAP